MASYIIREIKKEDDRDVEDIIRNCLIEVGGAKPGMAWEDDLSSFSTLYGNKPGYHYWVAEDENGSIVGGAGIAPLRDAEGVCELQRMYFSPLARGTGVAHKMLETVLTYAREFYDQCYLETIESMVAAQKMYTHYGFRKIDKPLGNTGHYSCNLFFVKDLK
ncbi:MAG: GNAT family N-acetyltransferase [Eggerthellaceae bacterium]|jgi:putative acetyltransferase